ncbi:hypothetical protein G5B47_17550 [Paenibacillus sp. 7124]|uniref:YhfM-like domain-containing protein n=1 Tax=Paenibacillus apii TaxID=1850370 RepID=A0A6M1PL82_9BACL|nr:hypothetical protein [Paenibacillus apii]NGM84219.1 hypothetical protein [Paenibacillus apii]NJJ40885.1 hypothetical protein [Paenibacillus apii]
MTIVLLLITACSSNAVEKAVFSQSEKIQDKVIVSKLQKDKTIQQYESQTIKDIVATFNNSSDTEIFIKAFKESEMIPGVVNVSSPTYEITLQKDGSESSYYLWITNNNTTSNAMYMYKGDTDTAYKITVESTNSINELLDEFKGSK